MPKTQPNKYFPGKTPRVTDTSMSEIPEMPEEIVERFLEKPELLDELRERLESDDIVE